MESHAFTKTTSCSGFLAQVIVLSLATVLIAWLLPGVHLSGGMTILFTGIVFAILNNFVRPILIVITLPFTIFTMGLFLLVINTLIVMFASWIVPSFEVDGVGNAFLFSLLLTLFNYLLELPNQRLRRPQFQENADDSNIEVIQNNHNESDTHFDDYEDVTEARDNQ